ncbi:MAG: sigma-70 family RNA polymerase sigma factor [Acidobacteriota bacterium]
MNEVESMLMDSQSKPSDETVVAVRLDFEQAFTAHHRVAYRYACALVHDPTLAEDVVQEVFLRLYKNLEGAQRDGLLRAWLLRVTANVARNAWRSRSRSQARDETFFAHASPDTDTRLPDVELVRQAEIVEARRALSKLKEPMRSCLLLKHEGLSYREIAAALNLKESNVGSLIARARQEFMRVYGKIGKL